MAEDYVVCKICGEEFSVIHANHLKKHGLTRDEYLEIYNLNPEDIISIQMRINLSERKDYIPYKRDDFISEVQNFYKETEIPCATLVSEYNLSLYMAGVQFFGNWDNALVACGINPDEVRLRYKWNNKEKVISHIKELYESGINLRCREFTKDYSFLMAISRSYFGSWDKALEASSIPVEVRGYFKLTDEQLLNETRKFVSQNKNKKKIPSPLYSALYERFGHLEGVAEILNIPPKKIIKRTNWNHDKLIKKIQELEKSGSPLNGGQMYKNESALYLKSCRFFGSWENALKQAGIEPNKARVLRKWSKDLVLKEIIERIENNKSLVIANVKKENGPLMNAAYKYFSTWKEAVEQAKKLLKSGILSRPHPSSTVKYVSLAR